MDVLIVTGISIYLVILIFAILHDTNINLFDAIIKEIQFLFSRGMLIIILFILVGIGFYLFKSPKKTFQDFGLNFSTEIIGVLITVTIIDRLIEIKKIRDNLPKTLACHEDVVFLINYVNKFWEKVYISSVSEVQIGSVDKLYDKNNFQLVFKLLDLESIIPDRYPNQKWSVAFSETHLEIARYCDKILTRNNSILEPEAYRLINSFASNRLAKKFQHLPKICETLSEIGSISYSPVLSRIYDVNSKEFNEYLFLIQELNKFNEKKYMLLLKYGDITSPIEVNINTIGITPPSVISKEKILKKSNKN